MSASRSSAKLSSTIKRARDVMRKDSGLNGDADRIPQMAWLLFLKAFDDMEERHEVDDPHFQSAIETPYRWRDWAADPTKRRSGPQLLDFVNEELIPYLRDLHGNGRAGDAGEVVGQVFRGLRNRMDSGYLLADVVDAINTISFASTDDIHTMAHLYESMLREMRDAAGDAGEFYTPRPLIRFIVGRVDPKPGETVMDPAVGTGGFLVEAWEHLSQQASTAAARSRLSETIRGFEKKQMPFLLSQMNLLLHGVDSPLITRGNALTSTLADQRKNGVDIVLTNPPFGGEEENGVKDNFPADLRTSETSWLFLQSVMARIEKSLSGRAAVVIPNGVLFDQGIGGRIKGKLMQKFNLHTVVRMPAGTFAPYTPIPTNILFFESGRATKDVWFYEHPLPAGRKNYSKTKPLQYEEFVGCEAWWGGPQRAGRVETEQAWRVSAEVIAADGFNLDLHNPNRPDDLAHRTPEELIDDLIEVESSLLTLLRSLRRELSDGSL